MATKNWFYKYSPRADFWVTDEDAGEFLQSQFSNDLRPFDSGRATYGLWLDVKGKVLGDSVLLCFGESRFRVFSERSDGATIEAHLERHVIADDVAIKSIGETAVFELSEAACFTLNGALPKAGQFVETERGFLLHAPNESFLLLVKSDSSARALCEILVGSGAGELSEAERGLLRMGAGRPLIPDEIGPGDLPGEGELEQAAISFTKGCYLGQEVVARMHNLGEAQRRLFVVEGAGAPPALRSPVFNDDAKQVGEIRSTYSQGDGWRGVALLKRRFVASGEVVKAGTVQVTIREPLSNWRSV